jgi:hypothetical protein
MCVIKKKYSGQSLPLVDYMFFIIVFFGAVISVPLFGVGNTYLLNV